MSHSSWNDVLGSDWWRTFEACLFEEPHSPRTISSPKCQCRSGLPTYRVTPNSWGRAFRRGSLEPWPRAEWGINLNKAGTFHAATRHAHGHTTHRNPDTQVGMGYFDSMVGRKGILQLTPSVHAIPCCGWHLSEIKLCCLNLGASLTSSLLCKAPILQYLELVSRVNALS